MIPSSPRRRRRVRANSLASESSSRSGVSMPRFVRLFQAPIGEDYDFGGFCHRVGALQQVCKGNTGLFGYLGNPGDSYEQAFEKMSDRLVQVVCDIGGDPNEFLVLTSTARMLEQIVDNDEDGWGLGSTPGEIDVFQRAYGCDSVLVNECLRKIAAHMVYGLNCLHMNGLCHGTMSCKDVHVFWSMPGGSTVRVESVKLSGYALDHLLQAPTMVTEKPLFFQFAPPEVLLMDPLEKAPFRPHFDIWAMGLILAHIVGIVHVEHENMDQVIERLYRINVTNMEDASPVSYFDTLRSNTCVRLDPDFADFLTRCLYINPNDRDNTEALSKHSFIREEVAELVRKDAEIISPEHQEGEREDHLSAVHMYLRFKAGNRQFSSFQELKRATNRLVCVDISLTKELGKALDEESTQGLLWQQELERNEESTETEKVGSPKKGAQLNSTANMIAAMILSTRKDDLKSTDNSKKSKLSKSGNEGANRIVQPFLKLTGNMLQLMTRRNIHYKDQNLHKQLAEQVRSLVIDHSEQHEKISCSFRARLWISLLGLPMDTSSSKLNGLLGAPLTLSGAHKIKLDMIRSKVNWAHEIDRQLEQDVPRCHQYHLLFRSDESRRRLARLLKAWVLLNPGSEYWQGLDSVAATVMSVFPGNDDVAFTVFNEIIHRFQPGMFSSTENENSALLHIRLQTFSRLLMFHDPELGTHLDNLQVKPTLYAIPWLLTMFAHVLPIHVCVRLWDYLFAEDLEQRGTRLILFSVCMLVQLRNILLDLSEFGAVVAFLTRLPVSLDILVSRALLLCDEAQYLAPRFQELAWNQQRRNGGGSLLDDNEIPCPIIGTEELLRIWDDVLIVDLHVPFTILKGSLQLKSFDTTTLSQVISKSQEFSKTVVAFYSSNDLEKVKQAVNWFVKEGRKPFVCIIEVDAVEKLKTLAPEKLELTK